MPVIRPKRRAIPVATKRAACSNQGGVCKCGCGMAVSAVPRTGTKFDHRPPLRLRDIEPDGSEYIPPQHSIRHIDAICDAEHKRRTHGTGATTAGTDFGAIKKERKRARPPKPKRKWASRPLAKGRKFQRRPQWLKPIR